MHPAQAHLDGSSFGTISAADAASFVFAIPRGRVTILGNASRNDLRDILDGFQGETSKPVLFADLTARGGTRALIEAAIDALAEAALRMWPLWYGAEDFSQLDGSILSRAALRIRLEALRTRLPDLRPDWALAAARNAHAGTSPRRAESDPAHEVAQLSLVLDRPIFAIESTESVMPDSHVAPIEWLARTATVPVLVLCRQLPSSAPPFDRWPRRMLPTSIRTELQEPGTPRPAAWLAPVIGQPHPFSEAEKKLAAWLRQDEELAPLFGFNRTVRSRGGRCHKVDLLWERGRIVVEIDGYAEHATRPKFRDDRHRDYELLMAGYRVLRITNDEVEHDCGRVLEKIRDVVRAQR